MAIRFPYVVLCAGSTDCHTSDVGHWFAMTRVFEGAVRLGGGTHGCRPTEEIYEFA